MIGYIEEHDAENCKCYATGNHGHTLAQTFRHRHGACHAYHIAHLAYSKEESGKEKEREAAEIYRGSLSYIIFEIVGYRTTSDSIEQIDAQRCGCKDPPRTVAQQRTEIGKHRRRSFSLSHTLPGEFVTRQKQNDTQGGKREHRTLPSCAFGSYTRIAALKEAAKRLPSKEGDKRTCVCKKHAVARKHGLFVGIIGNHRQHGTIRDVDSRIDRHHKYICHKSPHKFSRVTETGSSKQQAAGNSERQSHPQQPRAIFSSFCISAVGYHTHHGIAHCIPDARNQHKHSCRRQRQAEHVAVEYR